MNKFSLWKMQKEAIISGLVKHKIRTGQLQHSSPSQILCVSSPAVLKRMLTFQMSGVMPLKPVTLAFFCANRTNNRIYFISCIF